MNGYKIDIWTPIDHNGSFSHYITDRQVIHADSETEAREMVELDPEATVKVHKDLTIVSEEQFIYSVRYLGEVKHRVEVYYE